MKQFVAALGFIAFGIAACDDTPATPATPKSMTYWSCVVDEDAQNFVVSSYYGDSGSWHITLKDNGVMVIMPYSRCRKMSPIEQKAFLAPVADASAPTAADTVKDRCSAEVIARGECAGQERSFQPTGQSYQSR